MKINVSEITPNPMQPRTVFDPDEIEALAATMESDGLLNAISVIGPYDLSDSAAYYIEDGERRWRAAQLLGWEKIEATIRSPNGDGEEDLLFRALIGNLQREDMPPVDEARAFARLRDAGYSADAIAERVGKSNAMVYLRLQLLEFETETQELFNARLLPLDSEVMRALRRLAPEDQVDVAKRAARHKLSGSQILGLVTRLRNSKPMSYQQRQRSSTSGKQQAGPDAAPALVLGGPLSAEVYAGEALVKAVEKICSQCDMSEVRNGVICKDCPLTTLVSLCNACPPSDG